MNIPLNINLQQILLHWMNFAILAGGLYFLLYKPVKKFMDERTAWYEEQDRQAQEKVQAAETARAEYQARMEEMEKAVRQEQIRAQQAAQQSIQDQLAQANVQAKRILAQARVEADQTLEWARHESQREIRDLTLTAAKKLAARLDADPYDQFLDLAEKGTDHDGTA